MPSISDKWRVLTYFLDLGRYTITSFLTNHVRGEALWRQYGEEYNVWWNIVVLKSNNPLIIVTTCCELWIAWSLPVRGTDWCIYFGDRRREESTIGWYDISQHSTALTSGDFELKLVNEFRKLTSIEVIDVLMFFDERWTNACAEHNFWLFGTQRQDLKLSFLWTLLYSGVYPFYYFIRQTSAGR